MEKYAWSRQENDGENSTELLDLSLEWSFRGTGSSDYLMEIFNRCIVLACVPILLNVYGAFLIKRV